MKYSQLGSSSLRISQIGLGCMSTGTREPEAIELLHRAIDLGINYFDTADIYDNGANEAIIGKALQGRRHDIVLATKVGNVARPDGSGLDWNPSRAHIIFGVEESLKRLQTDYIDLYQLHGGTIHDPIDETIAAFEQLKQQGKIRFYGISSIRPNVIREYVKRSAIVSVMMQYSLLDRRPEEECLDLLLQNNIGVLARGSVAQGLLVNKPAKSYLDHNDLTVTAAAAAVRAVSNDSRTPSQTAIRFALGHPAVSSAVVGTRTLQQLEEAAATTNSPELTASELEQLQRSAPALIYKDHRH